jgi:acetyl esterase/lipase
LFQVGDCEVLLDDSIEFYRALRQQGHPVHLQVIPNMIHCGQMFSTIYRPGERAILSAAEFLQSSFPKNSYHSFR